MTSELPDEHESTEIPEDARSVAGAAHDDVVR